MRDSTNIGPLVDWNSVGTQKDVAKSNPSTSLESRDWPEVWKAVLRILESSIADGQVRRWIQPLECLGSKPSNQADLIIVELAAFNDFSANWVRDHFIRALESAFLQILGVQVQVQIVVKASASTQTSGDLFAQDEPLDPAVSTPVQEFSRPQTYPTQQIDNRFVFDSFVVGASNQFAHASAYAVAERPAHQYNPLFLYSAPGLGKTHLLHAIGNHILTKNPSSRVGYISAEGFMNELIESIQRRQMTQFRTKYRDSYDVLLIDDIQFIAGKKQTEEEFFHTFNALYASKRQIVLSSDRHPKEIEKLEERIRTRFEWGLIADVQPPEIETRIAILKAKAERDDIYLPDEVSTFLASHIKSNVRELEGILIRLQAHASLTGAEISLEMAKQELKKSMPIENSELTVESIQEAVAKHFGLKVSDLKTTTRVKTVAFPRQIAMFLIRKYTGMGFKDIGSLFGKDHTTILHACEKIENGMEVDPSLRNTVEQVQNLL